MVVWRHTTPAPANTTPVDTTISTVVGQHCEAYEYTTVHGYHSTPLSSTAVCTVVQAPIGSIQYLLIHWFHLTNPICVEDGNLGVAWHNMLLLVVMDSIASEFEGLGGQVLEHHDEVD